MKTTELKPMAIITVQPNNVEDKQRDEFLQKCLAYDEKAIRELLFSTLKESNNQHLMGKTILVDVDSEKVQVEFAIYDRMAFEEPIQVHNDDLTETSIIIPKDEEPIIVFEPSIFEEMEENVLSINDEKMLKIFKQLSFDITTVERGKVEGTGLAKQMITYTMVRKEGKIFLYKRLSGSGESRLVKSTSVGVGGHCNLADYTVENIGNLPQLAFINAVRELEEELNISEFDKCQLNLVGLLNDNSDEVGKDHFCFLFFLDVPSDVDVSVRETDVLEGEFLSLQDVVQKDNYEKMENWSKIFVDNLEKLELQK